VLLCFIVVASRAQNQRANVVVAPYKVNVYTVDGSGNPVNLVTSSSSIQENTVYHVTVSTSSSSSNVAGLLCRLFDGFEAGLWSGGWFVPYANPAQAQGDGTSFSFLIRTFSGWDFVLPLSMRTYERSEEHTSELQSRENLVCRLLLEKKKKNKITIQQ